MKILIEKVKDEIIQKTILEYTKAIKSGCGNDAIIKEETIWIIENVVAITIKELRKRRLLKLHLIKKNDLFWFK